MQLQGFELGFFAMAASLLLQFFWMAIGRRASNGYIRAITQYRRPTSALPRLYGWGVQSVGNSLLEEIVLNGLLLAVTAVYAALYFPVETIPVNLPLLGFVFVLSGASSLQRTRRVQSLVSVRKKTMESIGGGTDIIGDVRTIVNELRDSPIPDGRVWFVLFEVALRQDTTGYSVRDVLMDKSREIDALRGESRETKQTDTGGSGTGIQ